MKALIALLALAMVASCTVLPPDDTLANYSGTSAAVATPPVISAPPTTPARRDAKPAPEPTPRASSAKPAPEPTRARAKTASKTYRPGLAVVESASAQTPSPPSASSGGTTGPRTKYRVKMLDGTTQEIEQTGDQFKVGDWVRLTREGRLSIPVTHTR